MPQQWNAVFFLIALFLFVLTVILGIYLKTNIFNPEGKGREKETRRILRRYALLHRCRLLEDCTFEHNGQSETVQFVLIGPFGLLFLDSLGERGEYYGQVHEKNWVVLRKEQRLPRPNPLLVQERVMQAVREVFSHQGIYKIPLEQVVYINNPSKKTIVYISDDQVLAPGELKGFLAKTRFERDAGVNPEQLAALLEPYCKQK